MYTRDQLISALEAEHAYLCHDDFDPDVDMTELQYRDYLQKKSYDQLIEEAMVDEHYTIEQFMSYYLNLKTYV